MIFNIVFGIWVIIAIISLILLASFLDKELESENKELYKNANYILQRSMLAITVMAIISKFI